MTSPDSPNVRPDPAARPNDVVRLQELLKRCSPATLRAACEFRRTGRRELLGPVIVGVVERYVERSLRPRLQDPSDSLRLAEDLGLDSLTLMEIVLLAEDTLEISVSNEELCHLKTLGDIRRFIAAKASPAAPLDFVADPA